ncbi:glycosyltransferase [Candidatus Kuenenbacteria bacterium]|nr:glycosyltransferase [Candidatus Kuenenbacteria bacterium]
MIKICHIIGRLTHGGAEKLLFDLCRKIDKDKFKVEVLVLQEDNPLAVDFEQAGIKVTFFHKKGKFDLDLIKRLTQYLKTNKPDIVHTHLFAADFYGGKAAAFAGIKNIISTKHDILSEGFWRDQLGIRARRKFKKIIAISNATREHLIKHEKIEVLKIKVIYNGVDVNKFLVQNSKILFKENITIGSIGRLSKEKGHKHLIRACRFLKNKDWKLILVGDGVLNKEYKNLVKHLGVEDKVNFVGTVDDVRPYLEQMDVFVLPSISEGLSLAILEAALAGRFVIATNVGGVPEIIKNKENGLLFKPKNIEQLVYDLNWVNVHREQASKMAKKLQGEVVEKFNVNQLVEEYEKEYEKLVKS